MSSIIAPALAYPFEEKRLKKGRWCGEQKWDGHRVLTRIHENGAVTAWSRTSKDVRLPPHIREVLQTLPPGVYDGELIGGGEGGKSYDVSSARGEGASAAKALQYAVFDILEAGGMDLTENGLKWTHESRRAALAQAFGACASRDVVFMTETLSEIVVSADAAFELAKPVWERGGEGLILKEVSGLYRPGKRMQTWMKIKRQSSAVMTLVGFQSGLMGPYSVAMLEDDEGHSVVVKAKDFAWLAEMARSGQEHVDRKARVRIEFTERTQYGAYREPRWDRWEDEA